MDLPQPLGPIRLTKSPAAAASSMFSRTGGPFPNRLPTPLKRTMEPESIIRLLKPPFPRMSLPIMDSIEAKLQEFGLILPPPAAPAGSYVPYRINGNTLILSGVLAMRDGVVTHAGQVGKEQTVESGNAAAQVCALNTLAAIKGALGRLDRVKEFLFVSGFVNGVAGFAESPQVINGASDLFVKLYGEAGKHARAAVAVAGLPRNATVEIQVTVRFE